MGVKGLTTLLQEEGILPNNDILRRRCCFISNNNNNSINNNNTSKCNCCNLWWSASSSSSSCSVDFDGGGDTTTVKNSDSHATYNNRDCTYMENNNNNLFNVQTIRSNSTLLIDGNSLSFYLFKISYGRYYHNIVLNRQESNNKNNSNNLLLSKIPTFLPLHIIKEVTEEFVLSLIYTDAISNIRIYWDGHKRRLKDKTSKQRTSRRNEEWDNLEQYCLYGILPKTRTTTPTRTTRQQHQQQQQEYFLNNFPYPKLFLDEIRHTIISIQQQQQEQQAYDNEQKIQMIYCNEEADYDIAMYAAAAASSSFSSNNNDCNNTTGENVNNNSYHNNANNNNNNVYVIGSDSDFCLYRNIQYIPIETINLISPSLIDSINTGMMNFSMNITGIVLTRSYIVQRLQLPDEQSLIELSILLGNDYVTGTAITTADDDATNNDSKVDHAKRHRLEDRSFIDNIQEKVDIIKDNGIGFRVNVFTNKDNINHNVHVGTSETATGEQPHQQQHHHQQQQMCISFTRDLYELNDISSYPFDSNDDDNKENGEDNNNAAKNVNNSMIVHDIDYSLCRLKPLDLSLRDVILRPLRDYINANQQHDDEEEEEGDFDNNEDEEGTTTSTSSTLIINQEHLEACEKTIDYMMNDNDNNIDQQECATLSNVQWNDVIASFVIETCISRTYRSSWQKQKSKKLRQQQQQKQLHRALKNHETPSKIYDTVRFYLFLQSLRRGKTNINSNDNHHSHPVVPLVLPIDEYEEQILEAVETNRVTIIHGETGCGKSSRVPIMLLRNQERLVGHANNVKLFISQPRRIAVKSLVERIRSCEPDLKDYVALRMGHGIREYEKPGKTQAWFVTTGYLVRLLANHPEKFDDITHLIIDEVHERSVDTDILCLLTRRLLQSNKQIRVILMSATLSSKLYQQYFSLPSVLGRTDGSEDDTEETNLLRSTTVTTNTTTSQPPPILFVGTKRFPIREYFIEDIARIFALPRDVEKVAQNIVKECEQNRCSTTPNSRYMDGLHKLAVNITCRIARPGSSVLIFVPGMNDIIGITDLIENSVYVPGITYLTFPIHSDIPFEEQFAAFDSLNDDEIKVVIATNAAESSVTLPDVDHVICLGLCKQIVYNQASHRQILQPCWISKASATQRAGRTGRMREGNVYRLYTKDAMEQYMDEFEPGEMVRMPLDSVILRLKEILREEPAITPVFMQCLEPPDITTIARSFQSLAKSNFYTKPDDTGDITTLGSFVVALGIDLVLGSLIGLGIQFGVAAETIELASVLSFPQTPWIMTNPLYHEPSDYNDITARTFVSKVHFDALSYSEPFAAMNLIYDFDRADNKSAFCRSYSISASRVRRLVTTRNSLRKRVADYISVDAQNLAVLTPPVRMDHSKLTILRVLQVWVFSGSIIECPPNTALFSKREESAKSGVTISLKVNNVQASEKHLQQVLFDERHPFEMNTKSEIDYIGTFNPIVNEEDKCFDVESFLCQFVNRFLSFSLENEYDLMWYQVDKLVAFFVPSSSISDSLSELLRSNLSEGFEHQYLTVVRSASTNRRGRLGRACGLWSIELQNKDGVTQQTPGAKQSTVHVVHGTCPKVNKKARDLEQCILNLPHRKRIISCTLTIEEKTFKFMLTTNGNCSKIKKEDIKDIFATPHVSFRVKQSGSITQTVTFSPTPRSPLRGYKDSSQLATANDLDDSTWKRPLLKDDIPEGARLLSVLASGRRKDHIIRFSSIDSDDSEEDGEETFVDVALNRDETKISQRWKQIGTDLSVYLNENSVPAAATSRKELFACCANALEVQGGGLKVEGVTLLPEGRLFLLLSMLAFGMLPFKSKLNIHDMMDKFKEECIEWVWSISSKNGQKKHEQHHDEEESVAQRKVIIDSIEQAIRFHEGCEELGERLICHPEKVSLLCRILNSVDIHDVSPWDDLNDNVFTIQNLRKIRSGHHASQIINKSINNPPALSASMVKCFTEDEKLSATHLFATWQSTAVDEFELPSSNIFCMILHDYWNILLRRQRQQNDLLDHHDRRRKRITPMKKKNKKISLKNWKIYVAQDEEQEGVNWYCAKFINQGIFPKKKKNSNDYQTTTTTKSLVEWIRLGQSRPSRQDDALDCIPPTSSVKNISMKTAVIVSSSTTRSTKNNGKNKQNTNTTTTNNNNNTSLPSTTTTTTVLMFESMEIAIKMESAFWLEKYFSDYTHNGTRHWFEHTYEELQKKIVHLI